MGRSVAARTAQVPDNARADGQDRPSWLR